jgi:two-component system CheB/CheR fusion protein
MPNRPAGSRRAVRKPSRNNRAAAAHSDAVAGKPQPASILPYLTVAVGASAGGLHAFTTFLSNLPPDTGMAFVLIQHLDPIHKSLLVSLLAPHTAMKMVEAADGMPLAPNTVFVIPPDATMTISGGRLVISSPAPARVNRWPIDSFFASLAEDQKHHAVCIVLSGAGGDGSHGLDAVKQRGGLVLAQAGDDGQAMTGMPHSAVATGLVDHLLPVSAMPAKLLDYQKSLREATRAPIGDDPHEVDPEHFAEICALLRGRTGHDFSQYKKPTLLRRIHRRMQAQGAATVVDLIDLLRRQPEQIDRLLHELLIGVTQFMRDPAAFQFVQETVLPKILAGKGAGEQVRLWVPGCASGEEVYSLAILLGEVMGRQGTSPKVQIFGTDIDEEAIAIARAARYRKPALARLSPELCNRWFVQDGEFHRPVSEIREMCVFSVHNLIRDPPFSKLDMISCRNLLIYFGIELQSQVVRHFHYALNPGGYLFLGPSESVARGARLFIQIDKRQRIFQRQDAALSGVAPGAAAGPTPPGISTRPAAIVEDAIDRSARRALERYSPAYVVINRAREIIRFSGGAVGRFLEPSPGVASLSLFGILRKPLRRAGRAAVQKAIAGHETVVETDLTLALEGRTHGITLIVQPISDNRTDRDLYVVAFHDSGPMRGRAADVPSLADTAEADDQRMAQELAATRSQLLATITDLETANEELRSFNEEYQSTNEELQATNEELETAKEEMQSINEELQTINTELITKNELLTKLNNDLQNLLDSTQIATIFLDPDLHITRFTPPVAELFHLRENDLGRPITDIASRLAYADLPADVATVLDKQQIVERQVQVSGGNATFLMRMRPYRTIDKRVEGVVITFVDVTGPKRLQAEEALHTLNQTLERRVAERTMELEAAGRALTQQTEERQRAEEMLRQSQKLEAVGALTGGIAHDFNNLLGVIIGNAEFLLAAVRDNPDHVEEARGILDSALSGAELTRRLLAFARKQPLQPRNIDLNALLPGHVAMLGRALGESIQVTAKLAPELWLTHADPSQIGDALLNLALNARDAMPYGGSLVIETANAHLDDKSAAENAEMSEGDCVVLAVTDTGTGMPPEVIERATEPFFTTKPPGVGSGLGLSMIYGFAKQSGGHLRIDSEVGVGTTIRLYLPRARDDAAAMQDALGAAPPDPGGNEAILLVDDNPSLQDVTRRYLITLGYKVSTAASGPAALAALKSGERFDLLFTDVVMPERMSGYNLAAAARLLQPGLKLLFTTGHDRELPMDGNGTQGRYHMLRKPYRHQDLAKALRAALDGRPLASRTDSP